MVGNSNRDSEFSSEKLTDSLQTESSCPLVFSLSAIRDPRTEIRDSRNKDPFFHAGRWRLLCDACFRDLRQSSHIRDSTVCVLIGGVRAGGGGGAPPAERRSGGAAAGPLGFFGVLGGRGTWTGARGAAQRPGGRGLWGRYPLSHFPHSPLGGDRLDWLSEAVGLLGVYRRHSDEHSLWSDRSDRAGTR